MKRPLFRAVPLLALALSACLASAQTATAPQTPSLGHAAVLFVLAHYTINPLASAAETGTPLPSDGHWSISTSRPPACPQDTSPCTRVFYTVPALNLSCEWVVSLDSALTGGTVLEQNENAAKLLTRKLSPAELAPLVDAHPLPVYPAIARAAHVSGPVVVRLMVAPDGSAQHISLVSGPEMLRTATLQAAGHWTFHPLLVGTQPISFTIDLTADFRMPGGTLSSATVTMNP